MLEYDGVLKWEGFGGKFNLANGDCRLRLYNLKKMPNSGVMLMKSHIAIVSDIPAKEYYLTHLHDKRTQEYTKMTVRSCAAHVASSIVKKFNINPMRLLYVEYTLESRYGPNNEHIVPEKYEEVNFTWHENGALNPARYSSLSDEMHSLVMELKNKKREEAV